MWAATHRSRSVEGGLQRIVLPTPHERRRQHRDGRHDRRRSAGALQQRGQDVVFPARAARSARRRRRPDRCRGVRGIAQRPRRALGGHRRELCRELTPHRPVRIRPSARHRDRARPDSAPSSQRSASRTADRARRATDPRAPDHQRRLEAVEPVERPQRVQPGPRSPAPSRASFVSAARRTESPRSTSSRCAVSRHQPFGCDERARPATTTRPWTERGAIVAARRVVDDPVDPADAGSAFRASRDDLIPQVSR